MRKWFVRLVYLLVLCAVAGWWVLVDSLASAPSQADTETLHTIAYNNHGKTVFITPTQDRLRFLLPVAGLALALCVVLFRKKE